MICGKIEKLERDSIKYNRTELLWSRIWMLNQRAKDNVTQHNTIVENTHLIYSILMKRRQNALRAYTKRTLDT